MKKNIPLSMHQGIALRRLAKLTWGRLRWKIITVVREPVIRDISDIFQNTHHFPQLAALSGNDFIKAVSEELQHIMANFNPDTNYTVSWFDWEIKAMFGIDVYALPFDPARGYAIYQAHDADILVLRLEDLTHCAPQAFAEFLGLSSFQLFKANEASQKGYHQEYRHVTNTITFPLEVLDRIYASRYARHFYTDAEIETFKTRWSRVPTNQST